MTVVVSQPAFKVDLAVNQGATLPFSFLWQTGDPASPVDLTGLTARADLRLKASDATIWAHLDTADGTLELSDGTSGWNVRGTLTDEVTATFPAKTGKWDLEIEFADGTVRRLIEGSVTVSAEVTRPEGEP